MSGDITKSETMIAFGFGEPPPPLKAPDWVREDSAQPARSSSAVHSVISRMANKLEA
jgi:hypothetical protein